MKESILRSNPVRYGKWCNLIRFWMIMFTGCIACLCVSSCVYTHTAVRSFDLGQVDRYPSVRSGKVTKVHLQDGSMVLFEQGFVIHDDLITGSGLKYDLTRQKTVPISSLPLGEVKAVVYYEKKLQPFPTIAIVATLLMTFVRLTHNLNE